MKISKTIKISDYHYIEIGTATWDQSKLSIRNRYNQTNGRIDPKSSSEIPRNDLLLILIEAINNDLLNHSEHIEILEVLINKIKQLYIEQ